MDIVSTTDIVFVEALERIVAHRRVLAQALILGSLLAIAASDWRTRSYHVALLAPLLTGVAFGGYFSPAWSVNAIWLGVLLSSSYVVIRLRRGKPCDPRSLMGVGDIALLAVAALTASTYGLLAIVVAACLGALAMSACARLLSGGMATIPFATALAPAIALDILRLC